MLVQRAERKRIDRPQLNALAFQHTGALVERTRIGSRATVENPYTPAGCGQRFRQQPVVRTDSTVAEKIL
jgi:hypothetical protein